MKKNTLNTGFCVLCMASLLIAGCSDSDSGISIKSFSIEKVDFSNTSTLALIGNTSASQAPSTRDGDNVNTDAFLYSIDEEGNITALVYYYQVTGTDSKGNELKEKVSKSVKVAPTKVADMDNTFIWMYNCRFVLDENDVELREAFYDSGLGYLFEREDFNYLLRLSDGALFDVSANRTQLPYYENLNEDLSLADQQLVRGTKSGNALYAIGSEDKLYKYSVSGSTLQLELVAGGDYMHVSNLFLDANNNVLSTDIYYGVDNRVTGIIFPDRTVWDLPQNSYFIFEKDYEWYAIDWHINYPLQSTTIIVSKIIAAYGQAEIEPIDSFTTDVPLIHGYYNRSFTNGSTISVICGSEHVSGDFVINYDTQSGTSSVRQIPEEWLRDNLLFFTHDGYYYSLNENCSELTEINLSAGTRRTIAVNKASIPSFRVADTRTFPNEKKIIVHGTRDAGTTSITIEIDCTTGNAKVLNIESNQEIINIIQLN